MKFKLSTLLWSLTLVGVVLGSVVWIQKERAETAATLAKKEQEMAAFQKDINLYVRGEFGKVHYFKRNLGVINDSAQLKRAHVKLVRLPDELGGKQSFGLPFIWQWRFLLLQPNEFELCWALHDIPKDDAFDIPEEHIHRSHLNIAEGCPRMGQSGGTDSVVFSENQRLEVIVYFRIDGDKEGGSININYEICEPGELRGYGQTIYRGVSIKLDPDEVQWLRNCISSRGGYGSIAGFGIEQSYKQLPLLDQSFSLDEPLTLVKIRTAKSVGRMRYEPYPGPCLGIQVWIQKKTGPSTDLPKRIWIEPSNE